MSRIQVPSLEAIADLGELSPSALNDVFSQKVGEWAFATAIPTLRNPQIETPSRFAVTPEDGVVMSYLESYLDSCHTLPIGHLYDSALEDLSMKVSDPAVKELLENDLALRLFFRERRMGEVYE